MWFDSIYLLKIHCYILIRYSIETESKPVEKGMTTKDSIKITAISGAKRAAILIDGKIVLEQKESGDKGRGLNVGIISPVTVSTVDVITGKRIAIKVASVFFRVLFKHQRCLTPI